MNQEQRFSGSRGLQGCSVTWVCMVAFSLSISLVFNNWLHLISNETERVLLLFVWFFAICLGGYVAARLGKTTGWTNSLVVGILAEFFLFARLGKGGPAKEFLDPLLEMARDPGAYWLSLANLALTIPMAVLGGVIWQKTGGVQSSSEGQSEVVNKDDRAEK